MATSNIDKTEVDDWLNLDWKIKEFAHWSEYIFRGQAQDNWLLESTLSRALKTVKARNKKQLVTDHLRNFSLEIRGRRGDNPRSLTENELWALGQHFGLFTPLLDWTESPWIALFFSLSSIEKSETGKRALWALHKNDIPRINASYKKKKVDFKNWTVDLIEPTIDENSRLVNQRGLFTKIDVSNDIEQWVTKSPKVGDWVTLYKITYPDTLRQKALTYLNLMNINYSSLFPDLYGSSKNTNRKLLDIDYFNERKKLDWAGKLDEEVD
jgi:hypothetical protein